MCVMEIIAETLQEMDPGKARAELVLCGLFLLAFFVGIWYVTREEDYYGDY